MNIRITIVSLLLLSTTLAFSQSNRIKKSRVYLGEKQNRPAVRIPEILLEAYSKGEIKAYYPGALKREVSYAQFLNHFGMEGKAYQQIGEGRPFWFCKKSKIIPVDEDVMKCMQYNFELGEEVFRNNITYQQDQRLIYVKVIYSEQCADDGIEKDGPVFRIGDIKKLNEREHKIVNSTNSAVTYTIADYLALKLVNAKPLKR